MIEKRVMHAIGQAVIRQGIAEQQHRLDTAIELIEEAEFRRWQDETLMPQAIARWIGECGQ